MLYINFSYWIILGVKVLKFSATISLVNKYTNLNQAYYYDQEVIYTFLNVL